MLLAQRLGAGSVRRMLSGMDSRELSDWLALSQMESEEQQMADLARRAEDARRRAFQSGV